MIKVVKLKRTNKNGRYNIYKCRNCGLRQNEYKGKTTDFYRIQLQSIKRIGDIKLCQFCKEELKKEIDKRGLNGERNKYTGSK